jgi:hypothetical protein
MRTGLWRFAPLTGLLAAVLVVAGLFTAEFLDADEAGEAILAHYRENDGQEYAATFMWGVAAIPLTFFGARLARFLRETDVPSASLPLAAFGGAVIAAGGLAAAATIHLAITDASDGLSPDAAQAINAIDVDFFIPIAAGITILVLAGGLSILRSRALPRWLGWAAVVIAVASVTPAGFIAIMAGLAWIAIVSVLLFVRGDAPAAPTGGAMPGSAAAG